MVIKWTGGKPLTETEHSAETCSLKMSCIVCMSRCYDGVAGHIFHNGEDKPCDCGKYESVPAAQREWPQGEVMERRE